MAVSVSAVTIGPSRAVIFGNKKVTCTEVTLDSSYPTGGEPLTASDLGLRVVDFAITTVKSATGGGQNVANAYYDVPTAKLLVYDETPAEAGNTNDLSALVVQVVAFGSI